MRGAFSKFNADAMRSARVYTAAGSVAEFDESKLLMLQSDYMSVDKPIALSYHPIHAATVASRVYGNDAVVISPDEGMVRMLNPTATRIWQLADGSRSVEEIAAALTAEFDVELNQARQSVIRLLTELSEKQLISWVEPS